MMGGSNGKGYGAWPVVMENLGPQSIIYAAGIGNDISFDMEIMEQTGAPVHAFDPTPSSLEWLRKQMIPERYHVHEIGLAGYDGTASFFVPENSNHVSHSIIYGQLEERQSVTVTVNRLETIMENLGHQYIDVLKMDIEGAEYPVIEDMITSKIEVKQLLVEFHHRMYPDEVHKTRKVLAMLREAGYKVFYTSPRGEEYGFVK